MWERCTAWASQVGHLPTAYRSTDAAKPLESTVQQLETLQIDLTQCKNKLENGSAQ
jgi:hypothetical protein